MNDSMESSAEELLEAWRQRIAAFRIHPSQLSYIGDGRVVASGGFGQVKKAVYSSRTPNRSSAESPTSPYSKAPGITVAVKTLQIHMEVDQERFEKRFMREAYVWSQLKNEHIIEFLGFYFSCTGGKTEALLVCPWMENGQSVSYVKQQRLRPVERLHLLLDAAKGLQYLHSRVPPICHGDIKGSNVLIKNDGRAAICDFGLAQVLDEEFERLASQSIHRGTVRWTSPERLDDNGPLAPSSDVWSWAWLIWEFMTEKIPFHLVNNASAVIFHIVTLKLPAYDQEAAISEIPTLSKLMQLCWQKEPGSRLSMSECIERLEHILEGFEPPEPVGKDQNMTLIETLIPFLQTATPSLPSPSLPSGSPPPAELNPSDRTLFDPSIGIIPPLPSGASVPPAYTGPSIPSRSDKPRKDLAPIPGQDGETPILTTFVSSHEQRLDLEPSLGVKSWSANVPGNPPRGFNFISSHSQSPRNTTAGNRDPSYHGNSDGADLRHQIDYVMGNILRTLQRLECSQEQDPLRQQDITNYVRHLVEWLSRAPVFGSPNLSNRPLPIGIPADQFDTVLNPQEHVLPSILELSGGYVGSPGGPGGSPYSPTSPAFSPTSPSYSPISPTETGTPVQPPLIIQQPTQPTAIQPPTQIVPPLPGVRLGAVTFGTIDSLSISSSSDDSEEEEDGGRAQASSGRGGRGGKGGKAGKAGKENAIPPGMARLPGACKNCKRLKMRCVFESDMSTRCNLCREGNKECIVEGRKQRQPSTKREQLMNLPREKDKLIEHLSAQSRDASGSNQGPPGPLPVMSYNSKPSQHPGSPIPLTSGQTIDYFFPINTSPIRDGAGLPAIRQFKHSEIKLEPENEFDRKDEAQMGVILETGKAIAIKPVNFQLQSETRGSERALMWELDGWLRLWGSLEHENIAKVLGSAFVNEVPSVITEWCTSGNIAQYLEKAPLAERHSWLCQVAQGLNYLHTTSPKMIHSNLKPNNILIDDGRVKLADIGILEFLETRNVGTDMHGRAGDARWTAPEVLEGRARQWGADIYSFGCLALFILRDELPYTTLKTDVAVSKAIYRGDLPVSREVASALHSTWKLCWAQDPDRRPNMSTILESLESW